MAPEIPLGPREKIPRPEERTIDTDRVVEVSLDRESAEPVRTETVEPVTQANETEKSKQITGSIRALFEYVNSAIFAEQKSEEAQDPEAERAAFEQTLLSSLGLDAGETRAVFGVAAAIETLRDLYRAEDKNSHTSSDQTLPSRQFELECNQLLRFVLVMSTEPSSSGQEKNNLRVLLDKIQVWLEQKKIDLLVQDEPEENEDANSRDHDDDEILYDDEQEIEREPTTVLVSVVEDSEPAADEVVERRDRIVIVDEVLLRQKEVVWEDHATVVTAEPAQEKRWQRMIASDIIRGTLRKNAEGQSVLQIDFQPTPWFVEGRKEFVKKNKKYRELFPGAFERIRDPRRDEGYLPEDIFFESTGKAMTMFLAGRWDEYADTDEYRRYKKQQEEIG